MGLSAGDVSTINSSWSKVMAAKEQNGNKFLLEVLKNKANRDLFADFKGKSDADVQASPKLSEVSGRIMTRLDEFVKAAGDAGKLSGMLDEFAKKHVTYGVRSNHYEDMKGWFGAFLSSVGSDASASSAWQNFFSLLSEAFKKHES